MTPLAVSPEHAAELLDGISVSTVYRKIRSGELATVPNLRPTRIPVIAIQRYAEGTQ